MSESRLSALPALCRERAPARAAGGYFEGLASCSQGSSKCKGAPWAVMQVHASRARRQIAALVVFMGDSSTSSWA